MDFIQSHNRNQLEMMSLESMISQENQVRLIDAFAEKLDLERLGFAIAKLNTQGRPAFDSRVFLKIYFYGYVNGLRSSRKLEKECNRNIEMQWLTGKLTPNYHTIADFRKVNPDALRRTFKLFVSFLKDADLIAGELVAVDGTKLRAHNSKKNNFNPKKIERHIDYIEKKTDEYLKQLDEFDKVEQAEKISEVREKIERLKDSKIKYEALGDIMEDKNLTQISTTDHDSRALLVQGQVVEVSYNVQTAVDAKHKLVVATHTINRNDRNAMSGIAKEAKANLNAEKFTVLLDKGYHNGRELEECKKQNITTICAHAEIVNSNEKGTTPDYLVTKFIYNKEEDTYTCPQGQTLRTTGTWHKKTRERDSHNFKKYRTPACKECPVKHLCTGRAQGGRELDRSEFADAVEENNKRYHENAALYRKRQETNEHIFGTIKRVWGFNHTNLKGLKKVNGEMALVMTVYNFKRAINILGVTDFLEKLKKWTPDYSRIILAFFKMHFKRAVLRHSFFQVEYLSLNLRLV